jgi:hypothetical protein
MLSFKHIFMSYNLNREPAHGSIHGGGFAYATDPEHASGEFQRPILVVSLPCSIMRDYGLWYKIAGGVRIRVPYTPDRRLVWHCDHRQAYPCQSRSRRWCSSSRLERTHHRHHLWFRRYSSRPRVFAAERCPSLTQRQDLVHGRPASDRHIAQSC